MSRSNYYKPIGSQMANDLIREYLYERAVDLGDLDTLTQEDCRRLLGDLQALKESLAQTRARGGVIVIEEDDTLITAYRAGSFKAGYVEQKNSAPHMTRAEKAFLRHWYQDETAEQ